MMPEEKAKQLQDVISDQFDKLSEDKAEENTDVEEVEIQAEAVEETAETDETNEVEAQGDKTELDEEADATPEPEYDAPPPARWTQEMKEAYEQLPPAARKLMVENVYKPMQQQYTKTTTDLTKMREKVAPLLQIMEDYSGEFERAGANPIDAIRRQAAWANHFLKVGVEQGVKDMQKQFGVPTGSKTGQEAQEYLTPTERKLKAEVDDMRKILTQQQQEATQLTERQQQEQYQARVTQVHNELKSFIDEQKDGKPAHPYVERVAPQIAGIIRGGLVTQVDDYGNPVPIKAQIAQAYRMACDLDPTIRSVGMTSNDKRQVAKVKAAQDVNVVATMPSGSPSNVPMRSISDAVEDTYDRLAGRSA